MPRIILEPPFNSLWKRGYIREDRKGRKRVDLINSNTDRTTISYARYLVCVELGFVLSDEYEVDHIDADCSNDSLDNLQILTREEHTIKTQKEATTGRTVVCRTCPACGITFRREKRCIGRSENVFCSRSCNGRYNAKAGNLVKLDISQEKKEKIRELSQEGLSGYSISKLLGISRNTVYKYIKLSVAE